MTEGILLFHPLDGQAVEALLCDADGNLFASEEPAYEASAAVTNRLLAELDIDLAFDPPELRRRAMGRNFRSTAQLLAAEAGKEIDSASLEEWVLAERREVIAHLASVLEPDPEVDRPMRLLAGRFRVAVVSSSAQERLAACFRATALEDLFPAPARFSAEDSLPVPTSKPDPAIYSFAGRQLGLLPAAALAVEDAVVGARSAIAAGFATVGNLQFVPADERERRIADLRAAGVAAVVDSWSALAVLLGVAPDPQPPAQLIGDTT